MSTFVYNDDAGKVIHSLTPPVQAETLIFSWSVSVGI